MSRRVTTTQGRRSRRKITLIWVVALSALVITLLVLEQTALLYVLATLGVTALLVVVALADLSGARKAMAESAHAPADDAAALGTGIASTMPATTTAAATATARPAPRAAKRR